MYKDKDKQREANRIAAKRRRDKAKGITIDASYPATVIPSSYPETNNVIPVIPKRHTRQYIINPLPGQPPPRTSPPDKIRQLITSANVQSVAKAVKPQQQRINHHPMCKCYQCKPVKT